MANDLPPRWYSALERWLITNKVWLYIALFVLIFFIWPLFQSPRGLDERLLPPEE